VRRFKKNLRARWRAPALENELGSDIRGRSAIVIGTGGAARAAVAALADLGVARILVRARDVTHVDPLRGVAPGVKIEAADLRAPDREPDDLAAIIQATSCGMTGGPPGDVVADAVAWAEIAAPGDVVAVDVVYTPRETPFLVRARSAGLSARDGIGMLVGQGALAFELWLGVAPPLDVMRSALLDQLA